MHIRAYRGLSVFRRLPLTDPLNKYLRRNSQGFNRSGIRSAFESRSLKLNA